MKKNILLLVTCVAVLFSVGGCQKKYPFQDPDLSLEERLDDLIGRMTLDEKISQMMNTSPAIDRLGIPAYNWWNECLHGVARSPYRVTSFPQAIGLAATWNEESVYKVADYASDEGRAIYHNSVKKNGAPGIFCGLTYWSPNINIFRDPRWGRGQETYGEDPYLTGSIGAAFVKGIQGTDSKYLKASACAKHFAVHSGPEWNRHTFDAEISNHDLWDTYLPAFEKLVTDAKVSGVMCAYNSLFGQACCGNDLLLMDILKNQWEFNGYVTSDCGAVEDIYLTHKLVPDAASAASVAVLHGTDCECSRDGAYKALKEAVEKGLITEEQIDVSVKKLFEIRFRLGMFDPDERVPYSTLSLDVLESKEHQDHALRVAEQSIVLLKNQNNLLPLDASKIKKIAVVGPNADDKSVLLANYYGYPSKMLTVLDAIKEKVGQEVDVVYEKGVNLTDEYVFTSYYDDNLFKKEGVNGFQAEYFTNVKMDGKPTIVRREGRPDYQWGDSEEIGPGVIARHMSAKWTTTFTPVANGEICFELKADDRASLFIDGVEQEKLPSINSYYILKAEAGKSYEIEICYIQSDDNAEIFFDMGLLTKADYQATAQRIKDADIILYVGGLSSKVEGEEMPVKIEGFRGGDRETIELPNVQHRMLEALQSTGKPVVFVLLTGSAVGLEWEANHIPAIVNAWYGGQAGGQAIANVLFGDYNPAGRLPVTFYKSVNQLPDYEDYNMDNRTYRYFKGIPQYPFGYGLSYTTFSYNNLIVERMDDGRLNISVSVTNTGDREGDEVVQLYMSNPRNFVTPIRALKGFNRIKLQPGEMRKVDFILSQNDLCVVDESGHSLPMQGDVTISVGGGQPTKDLISKSQCCITNIQL